MKEFFANNLPEIIGASIGAAIFVLVAFYALPMIVDLLCASYVRCTA